MRYGLALVLLLLVAAFMWRSPTVLVQTQEEGSPSSYQVSSKQTATQQALSASSEFRTGQEERIAMQIQQQAEQFKTLYKQAKNSKQGNLQPWLEKLWRQCKFEKDADCKATLQKLAEFLTATELQWLTQAVENFDQYYVEMTELSLSNDMTAQQRFSVLSQIREKHFIEQTDDVFGLEHSYAQYQFDYDYLRQVEASQLTVEQRMKALDRLQAKTNFGDSQNDLIGPDSQYQQALSLIEDLPEQERLEWQSKLRTKYFGDAAEEVAAYEQRMQDQQQQQQNYKQALEALKQRADSLGGINSPAYQQELTAIRQQLFN